MEQSINMNEMEKKKKKALCGEGNSLEANKTSQFGTKQTDPEKEGGKTPSVEGGKKGIPGEQQGGGNSKGREQRAGPFNRGVQSISKKKGAYWEGNPQRLRRKAPRWTCGIEQGKSGVKTQEKEEEKGYMKLLEVRNGSKGIGWS